MAVDGTRVDPLSGGSASATIYTDESGLRWSCVLNYTDVSTGVYGSNKFFMVQVIEDNGVFTVLQRFGRLGTQSRQYSRVPFGDSLELAKAAFAGAFQAKTGHSWPLTGPFERKKGRYALIELEDVGSRRRQEVEPEAEYAACTLPLQVQELLELIASHEVAKQDLKALQDTMHRQLPLGRISKAQIAHGHAIIQQLTERIEELTERSASPPLTSTTRRRSGQDRSQDGRLKAKAVARGRQALASNAAAISELKEQLKTLSSEFYSVIPHSFARSVPPTLDSIKAVKEKLELLQVIGNVESNRDLEEEIVKRAERLERPPHPLDARYKAIGATMEPLDESQDEFKMIQRYAFASSAWDRKAKSPIHSVLKVVCHAEDEYKERFDSIDNHQLLWHGTRVSSAVGILSRGLRIAPALNGSTFGRGIYFADTMAKSLRFCSVAGGRKGIIFLAEVALGTQHLTGPTSGLDLDTLRSKFKSHSVHGAGSMQPAEDEHHLTPNGVKVPLGTLKSTSLVHHVAQLHNEFVVYHPEQVKLRYLVTVNF